jgi:hypothetical protein
MEANQPFLLPSIENEYQGLSLRNRLSRPRTFTVHHARKLPWMKKEGFSSHLSKPF